MTTESEKQTNKIKKYNNVCSDMTYDYFTYLYFLLYHYGTATSNKWLHFSLPPSIITSTFNIRITHCLKTDIFNFHSYVTNDSSTMSQRKWTTTWIQDHPDVAGQDMHHHPVQHTDRRILPVVVDHDTVQSGLRTPHQVAYHNQDVDNRPPLGLRRTDFEHWWVRRPRQAVLAVAYHDAS